MNAPSPDDFGHLGISLPDDPRLSLAERIYAGVREAIVAGRMVAGQRLPSSRALAVELGVARGTVVEAYEHLRVEGYVRTKQGAGTYVDELPERFLNAREEAKEERLDTPPPRVAARAAIEPMPYIENSAIRIPRPLQTGLAPLDGFPRHLFARLASEAVRAFSFEDLSYSDPRGYFPLRQAIASYLRTARAVDCEPDQIFVTNGAQHALSLAAHVLLDPGESVWMENPGYPGAHAAFEKAGLELIPVPIDSEGISVAVGRDLAPRARLVYVSPSHQYPLGVAMSLPRRRALIEWAMASGSWIIEDDYDSEYRYEGLPLPSLYHLNGGRQVIHVGSFSKVLAPGLRLGYLIVPTKLVDTFLRNRSSDDHHGAILLQTILARFIARGHYGRHLRRMRKLGATRRDALVESCARRLPDRCLFGTEGGLHASLPLDSSIDDVELSVKADGIGLSLSPISACDMDERPLRGFALGYAAYTEKQIDAAVAKLATVLGAERGQAT